MSPTRTNPCEKGAIVASNKPVRPKDPQPFGVIEAVRFDKLTKTRNGKTNLVIQGNAYYAKVLGAPAWGFKNQYKEWSFDLCNLSDETIKRLTEAGMVKSVVKNKGDARENFITFKRRETKKDGTPGKPFEIVDRKGQPWDQKALIGNGSKINVKIALNEVAGEIKPGAIKIQVVEHVPYEGRGDDEDLPIYTDDTGEETWS